MDPAAIAQSDAKSKLQVAMVVPNKFVKKMFEFVLKSDMMKAFVKEYEEDGPNWLNQFVDLVVRFETTTGDKFRFSKMERSVQLKFKTSLEAKLKQIEEEKTKQTIAEEINEGKTAGSKMNKIRQSEDQKAKKSGQSTSAGASTPSAATKGSKTKITVKQRDHTTHKLKPVSLVEKQESPKQVSSKEVDDNEWPFAQFFRRGAGESALLRQIREAIAAKNKRKADLSESESGEEAKVKKPKKKKVSAQGEKKLKK